MTGRNSEAEATHTGKRRIFPLLMLFYVLLLIGAGAYFLTRLYRLLVSYEAAYQKSLPDFYAREAYAGIAAGNTDGMEVFLADGNAPGDDVFNNLSIVQDYLCKKAAETETEPGKLPGEIVQRTAGEIVYEFASEGTPFLRLTLAEQKDALPYGFSSWEAVSARLLDETFLPSEITIRLPDFASAAVDGTPLDERYVTESGERITLLDKVVAENLVREDTVPTIRTLTVQGIFQNPNVEIKDADGVAIACTPDENGVYDAAGFFAPEDFSESVSAYVEGMLEPWGLFFSRDGSYYNIQRYFWPGSPVDRYLPKVDVSWMQYHNRVAFEDKRVENYRLYNDSCFSCDVHFSQIIGVGNNPEVRRWDTDMTWIFVKRAGTNQWLLADLATKTGSQTP